jgi:glucuronoarabinoxylan endo-1,4-beta-xylanase
VSKRGYVMSQFARFVRPGSIRVHSIDNAKWTLVDVTAFRKDSRLILVAVNRNSKARKHTFTLWNGTAGAFTPYVTSKTKNCELQGAMGYKNGNFTYTLEPLSVTTFISN